MKNYELSVIIPLHNTDITMFSNCIASLKAQEIGFDKIETVVVMHNCDRETMEGVRKLLMGLKNVVLEELNNDIHSPSSPRNHGIDRATGDYITFLDADDRFTPECLRLSLFYIKESEADVCHFRKKLLLEEEGAVTYNELELWDQTQEMIVMERDSWDQRQLFSGVWGMSTGRLYRRKLLIENDLRFDESIKFAEDYHFVIGVYAAARRICLAPQLIGYVYYVNGGSLVQTTSVTEALMLDYVAGFKKVFDRGLEAGLWMNDTMGHLMLIILNWMRSCPDLTDEGRRKLKVLMGPYIRSLEAIPPSKLYSGGRNDRINTMLTRYILREEPHTETFIARGDEGAGRSLLDRQKDALARILENGMKSDYSRHYGFGEIATIEEYQRRVPGSDYETYLPMIRLTTDMGERGIFTDREIIAYAASEKNGNRLPITHKAIVPYVNALRRSLGSSKTFLLSEALPFMPSRLTMDHKYTNSMFGVMLREYVAEAESFGSGYAEFTTPKEELFPETPRDMTVMRWVYALRKKDVEVIFSPAPEVLTLRLRELKNNWEGICREIEIDHGNRADALPELSLKALMPSLKRIVCWNCTDQDLPEDVKRQLEGIEIIKKYDADEYALYGEIDDEGCISLDMDHVFYEFYKDGEDAFHTVNGISEGEEYHVLLSNLCGLYRYDAGIFVKCVKVDHQQAVVKFAGGRKK